MPAESGTTISDFEPSRPLEDEPVNEGDDHLRLIKQILQTQFPGELGSGFAIPITATEAEINHLSGVTSNIQDQLDDLSAALGGLDDLIAPQGTILLFAQDQAPNGWTRLPIANDNRSLRVIGTSGTGGTEGGTQDAFNISLNHNHATKPFTLGVSHMPQHHHFTVGNKTDATNRMDAAGDTIALQGDPTGIGENFNYALCKAGISATFGITSETGNGNAHNHGDTENTNLTWTPRYLNVIRCSKD